MKGGLNFNAMRTLAVVAILVCGIPLAMAQQAESPPKQQHTTSNAPFLKPAEAVAKMSIPEGFEVSIFASEPDIAEPIAFCFDDRHETLNSFNWGPDGWLYGCHGVFTHSQVGKPGDKDADRQFIDGGIWRYHPTRKTFEIFARGLSNPWGFDFDDHGQGFATCCVIPHLFHIVQGGVYHKQSRGHVNPYVRSWAIQFLCDASSVNAFQDAGKATKSPVSPEVLAKLATMAKSDESPIVRLYLASAALRMPFADRWPVLAALASHGEDVEDNNLPRMIWFALEPMVPSHPRESLQLAVGGKIPKLQAFVARRMVTKEAESGGKEIKP